MSGNEVERNSATAIWGTQKEPPPNPTDVGDHSAEDDGISAQSEINPALDDAESVAEQMSLASEGPPKPTRPRIDILASPEEALIHGAVTNRQRKGQHEMRRKSAEELRRQAALKARQEERAIRITMKEDVKLNAALVGVVMIDILRRQEHQDLRNLVDDALYTTTSGAATTLAFNLGVQVLNSDAILGVVAPRR